MPVRFFPLFLLSITILTTSGCARPSAVEATALFLAEPCPGRTAASFEVHIRNDAKLQSSTLDVANATAWQFVRFRTTLGPMHVNASELYSGAAGRTAGTLSREEPVLNIQLSCASPPQLVLFFDGYGWTNLARRPASSE
jgi:hypothetical protein